MPIEVTARHIQVTDGVQAYAHEKAEALMAAFPRIEHVHWILDTERHDKVAELVIQGKNHIRVDATETSDNIRASIDGAWLKAEKQMRKLRQKIKDHKGPVKPAKESRTEGERGEEA